MKKQFRTYEDARKFVHTLKIKNIRLWKQYCKSGKKPDDIPANPVVVYKNQKIRYSDWLGTGTIATIDRNFLFYKDAKKNVKKLKLKSRTEWNEYKKTNKIPSNIPKDPPSAYQNKGWKGWGDFLGTGHIKYGDFEFQTFQDARKFAHSLRMKNQAEWKIFTKSIKKPKDIPADPSKKYKNQGWKGWGDFLGTGTIAPFNIKFLPFIQAREYIRSLGLQSQNEWNKYRISGKKPKDIPSNPFEHYGKEWTNWGDWFGTDFVAFRNRKWLPWKEAKLLYQKYRIENKISNKRDWEKFIKKNKLPKELPIRPWEVYTESRILQGLNKK